MNGGLYSKAEIARYLGCRDSEVARMIREDGLPVITLPGVARPIDKITLHGLHTWMSARHSGTAFMSVEDLAAEIAAANAQTPAEGLGLLQFHRVMNLFFKAVRQEQNMGKEAA